MGVRRDFYNPHSFVPGKVMKFALGLFLNEISNFPPFYFSVETSSGYGDSYDMPTCFLIMTRVNVNILKQP